MTLHEIFALARKTSLTKARRRARVETFYEAGASWEEAEAAVAFEDATPGTPEEAAAAERYAAALDKALRGF